jgi:type III secretory pathway lipoprotein EscJ
MNKRAFCQFDLHVLPAAEPSQIKTLVSCPGIPSLQVEKAPVVVKASVAKADAENMKKLIEAAGGKVTLA